MIARLERAFERIETRLALREAEIVRLRAVEAAAATALADLDHLIEAAGTAPHLTARKDKQWAR